MEIHKSKKNEKFLRQCLYRHNEIRNGKDLLLRFYSYANKSNSFKLYNITHYSGSYICTYLYTTYSFITRLLPFCNFASSHKQTAAHTYSTPDQKDFMRESCHPDCIVSVCLISLCCFHIIFLSAKLKCIRRC